VPLYLIHLDPPYQHARHYLGYVKVSPRFTVDESIATRLDYHRRGAGSRLLRAASRAGAVLKVVRVWPEGTQTDERRLKGHSSTRLCPICNPDWEKRGRLVPSGA
jgi:hypothetical protein